VVNTQSLADVTERAEDLIARGVRRVVAIFVREGKISEWSPRKGEWKDLDLDGSLHDRVLATPLPLRGLLEAVIADDVVARAGSCLLPPDAGRCSRSGGAATPERFALSWSVDALPARTGACAPLPGPASRDRPPVRRRAAP
jgi:hypothetical protein